MVILARGRRLTRVVGGLSFLVVVGCCGAVATVGRDAGGLRRVRRAVVGGVLAAPTVFSLTMPVQALETAATERPSPAVALPPTLEPTDEYDLEIRDEVGVELEGVAFARTTLGAVPSARVAVKRVVPGSKAAAAGVERGWILVSANGQRLESLKPAEAAKIVQEVERPLTLRFRDPTAFQRALRPPQRFDGVDAVLDSRSPLDADDDDALGMRAGGYTATVVLPPSAFSDDEQRFAVLKRSMPSACSRGARRGDLLELRYEARLAQDGALFDGSALQFRADGTTIPGRGGDSTIYFVLGMQPVGQFPPAWDAALAGCCVGEIREIAVPPVLGFGAKGVPRRGVPPNASLRYIVELLSINGINLPR